MKVKFLDGPTGATMKGGIKEFGEYLISLRDARKQTDPTFSLRGVASKIGISPTFLSKIERGEQPPSEKTIRKLAEVFGAGELMRMTREFQEKFGEDTGFKMAMKTKKEEFSDAKDHALAIDDLGKEPPEMLSYGTRHDYMTEAIEERYNAWARRGWVTIFSTQMSPEEIRKRYPAHIADRIGEMTVPVFLARRSRRESWL